MISLNWELVDGDIGSLMQRYAELPRHIAKKHLQASMKRALKDGVPVLKRNTPVGKTMRANAKGVVKMRRNGALRRAVTTRSKYVGRNKDGFVVGTLGYKGGTESRKAIWLEFGTSRGLEPRKMVERSMAEIGPRVSAKLAGEMSLALEKAAAELASGKNPGYQGGK